MERNRRRRKTTSNCRGWYGGDEKARKFIVRGGWADDASLPRRVYLGHPVDPAGSRCYQGENEPSHPQHLPEKAPCCSTILEGSAAQPLSDITSPVLPAPRFLPRERFSTTPYQQWLLFRCLCERRHAAHGLRRASRGLQDRTANLPERLWETCPVVLIAFCGAVSGRTACFACRPSRRD